MVHAPQGLRRYHARALRQSTDIIRQNCPANLRAFPLPLPGQS